MAMGQKGKERFILADVGVTFPAMDGTPGVDLIMADTKFIQDKADQLDGIFITHAHEESYWCNRFIMASS